MPVGNDVVDLRDPEAGPGSVHPRFDARVFTDDEREDLEKREAPERLRWSLWAAKESVFKAASKMDPGVRFIPRRFAVRMLNELRAEVRHGTGRFRVWLEQGRDWVHAVAAPEAAGSPPPGSRVERLEDGGRGASARVRRMALDVLAPDRTDGSGGARILTPDGVPELWEGGRKLPLDLSLSHHGQMIACVWEEEG